MSNLCLYTLLYYSAIYLQRATVRARKRIKIKTTEKYKLFRVYLSLFISDVGMISYVYYTLLQHDYGYTHIMHMCVPDIFAYQIRSKVIQKMS